MQEGSEVFFTPPPEIIPIEVNHIPAKRFLDLFSSAINNPGIKWKTSPNNSNVKAAHFGDHSLSYQTNAKGQVDPTTYELVIRDSKADPQDNPIATMRLQPRRKSRLDPRRGIIHDTTLETVIKNPRDKIILWEKIDTRIAKLQADQWQGVASNNVFSGDSVAFAKQALRTRTGKNLPSPAQFALAGAALVNSESPQGQFLQENIRDWSDQYPVRPRINSEEDQQWRQNYASIDTNPVSEQYETEAGYERYLLHINEDYLKEVPLTDQHISALTSSSRQAWEMYQPYVRESDFGFWQLATLDVIRNMYSSFGEIPEPEYLTSLHKGVIDSLMMGDDYYINFRAMRMNQERSVFQGNKLTSGGLQELNQIQNRWNSWITNSYSRLFYADLIPEQSLLEDPQQLFKSLEGVNESQLKYYIFASDVLGVPPSEVVDFYKKYFSVYDLLESDDPDSQEYAYRLLRYAEALRDGNVSSGLLITQEIIDNISDIDIVDGNAFTGLLDQNGVAELAPIVIPPAVASTPTPLPTETPKPTTTSEPHTEKQVRKIDSPQEDQGSNKVINWLLGVGGAVTATSAFLRLLAKRRARVQKKSPTDFSNWYGH